MSLLKRVFRVLTKRQKRVSVILFFMMLVGAALETIGTSMILPLITVAMEPQSVLENSKLRFVYELIGADSPQQFLKFLIVGLIIVYIVKNVYLYFMYYAQYRFVYNGQYNMSRALFKDYVHRPYEFFLDASTPVVIRTVASDVNGVYSLILTLLQLFTEAIIFVALFIVSLVVSPAMTLLIALFLGTILVINKKLFGPILRQFGHEVQFNSANVTKWLMQAMSGMKETKVLNRERFFVEKYEESAGRLNMIQLKQSTMSNVPRLSIETVMMVSILTMVGILLGGGGNVSSSIGQIAVLAMVGIRIMPSANRITQAINNVAYYEPSLSAVEDIIIHAHETGMDQITYEAKDPEPLSFEREVRLEHITYRYPNTDVDILKDAQLVIPRGKSIGLIGPSGAGKSTSVDIILGLLKPQSGTITVDGVNIEDNLPGWYDQIGYVPQMMYMLDDTIRANVAYGVDDTKVSEERIWEVLKEAQMDEFIRALPHGLDTSIGERGVRLSGGQRQRIGIARALYNNPEIMIFDEATSSLDNDTEAAIMEAIERLHGKKTLIIVAHRLTTIEKCDAVYKVDEQQFLFQSAEQIQAEIHKSAEQRLANKTEA